MNIKIILVDDHKMVRSGLRTLLEQNADMEVIAEATDGRKAVELARELSPDVVVIDISMPGLNGIEATRQILAAAPKVKVVALSMHSDKRFVTGMLEAGASGYLLKGDDSEELITAIRAIAANKAYLSPDISKTIIKDYVNYSLSVTRPASSPLTAREREVLQLLAEGRNAKDIASRLYISIKTVNAHRHNIMSKLNIHTIAELTKYAIREGLTSLDT